MRILVTGTSGLLGAALLRRLIESPTSRGDEAVEIIALSRTPLGEHPLRKWESATLQFYHTPTLSNYEALPVEITHSSIDAIIHCGALSSPLACHHNQLEAWNSNAESARTLATLAATTGAYLTYVSTDLVFEGASDDQIPLTESIEPSPLSIYARSKRLGEEYSLQLGRKASVIRIPLLLGRSLSSSGGALGWMITTLSKGENLYSFEDEFRTPLSVEDAVTILVAVMERQLSGIWHASASERFSRYQLGLLVAEIWGLNSELVVPSKRSDLAGPVPRPRDVSLDARALNRELAFTPTPIRTALTMAKNVDSFTTLDRPSEP